MRNARCEVIDPNEVNIVHACSRTVRRCFLFGDDPLTGHNYDHRKEWIEEYLQHFSQNFAIEILSFAILSNHYHIVFRTRPDVVDSWDDAEVARRWLMICPHRCDENGKALPPTKAELDNVRNDPIKCQDIRVRLSSVSWWMRLMNQRVATRSNAEDGEKGRFFQDRFKATRILDEAGLIACCAYVDLNPIRAAMAQTIETSDHTSAQRRIESMRERAGEQRSLIPVESIRQHPDHFLCPVSIDESSEAYRGLPKCIGQKGFLPMSELDYIELLDWTARQSRQDKCGVVDSSLPPVLERLDLSPDDWTELVCSFGKLFHDVAGRPESIDAARSHRTGRRFRVRPKTRALLDRSAA